MLVVDRGGWEVYPETDRIDKKVRTFKMSGLPRQNAGSQDYHIYHVENFIDCMRTRQNPRSDVGIGHNSMIACHLGNMAQRLGRKVRWDVENERVIDDAEAQNMVTKDYRSPWKLPKRT